MHVSLLISRNPDTRNCVTPFMTPLVLALLLGAQPTALKFHESAVAGGPTDLMIVRRLRLEGTNEQIGAKLTEIARTRHHVDEPKGDPAILKQELTWLKGHYPEQYARSMGCAKAFGITPGKGNFDPTAIGYNIGLAKPGCSVVFYPGGSVSNGHSMLSRNYDFPTGRYGEIIGRQPARGARSFTGDPYIIETHPDKGYASLFTCAYDLLGGAIDGVNEKGLAVALLADDMSTNKRPANGYGLSEVTLPRFVLERCATAKQARAALKSVPYYYTFTPCHYMICDASGDSFIWEIEPDKTKRYVVDGKGKPQIVTNHLVSKTDGYHMPNGNSYDRFRRLRTEIENRKGRITPKDVQVINTCVAVPTEARGAATLWHAVYDLKARKVKISFFLGKGPKGERRTPYLDFGFTK